MIRLFGDEDYPREKFIQSCVLKYLREIEYGKSVVAKELWGVQIISFVLRCALVRRYLSDYFVRREL